MATTEDPFLISFGKHLKQIRENSKISLRKLDQLSEVDYSQIHKIEKGISAPSLTTLNALAKALKITLAELVTFEVRK